MKSPLQLGGEGPAVHFLHANGYPPRSYRSFLKRFHPSYQVVASPLRPLWPDSEPDEIGDWTTFRDDFLRFLRQPEQYGMDPAEASDQDITWIGMGHSLGATVTLLAALVSPQHFQALVLIEPVVFPSWLGVTFRFLSQVGLLAHVHPLIGRTLKRRREFDSEEDMFQNYRQKDVFAKIPDHVLWDYVRGMARTRPDGKVELAYPPEWEAKIYQTGGVADPLIWSSLESCQLPVLLIRGEMTETLWMAAVKKMSARLSGLTFVNMAGVGHLAPLEAPGRVHQEVQRFLDSL